MTRDDLIDRLRASEASLYSPHLQNLYLDRSDDDRAAFVQMRQAIANLVNQVTTLELSALNDRLTAHDMILQGALEEIQEALADASEAKTTLLRVSTAVGVISGLTGAVGSFFLQ